MKFAGVKMFSGYFQTVEDKRVFQVLAVFTIIGMSCYLASLRLYLSNDNIITIMPFICWILSVFYALGKQHDKG